MRMGLVEKVRHSTVR